jgi:hypothetical protein
VNVDYHPVFPCIFGGPNTSPVMKYLGIVGYMGGIIEYPKVSEYGKSLHTDISK